MMSGSVIELFEILKLRNLRELSCEIMARETAQLWNEIRINVGDRVYAEDAGCRINDGFIEGVSSQLLTFF